MDGLLAGGARGESSPDSLWRSPGALPYCSDAWLRVACDASAEVDLGMSEIHWLVSKEEEATFSCRATVLSSYSTRLRTAYGLVLIVSL